MSLLWSCPSFAGLNAVVLASRDVGNLNPNIYSLNVQQLRPACCHLLVIPCILVDIDIKRARLDFAGKGQMNAQTTNGNNEDHKTGCT